jgi:enterobactin synthetase component D / holo-[acyl-carrier protein] synthase
MLATLLPPCVAAVETRETATDATLFDAEQAAIARAVSSRRAEYATVRACARAALGQLGRPSTPIINGEFGEPVWPAGVSGSMTHCVGYYACAVARSDEVVSIGIDAEPDGALPPGILDAVATGEELTELERLKSRFPQINWDRLIFSVKETVYKAWFPHGRRRLTWEDAVVSLDPGTGTFSARVLVSSALPDGRPLTRLEGRWLAEDGLVLSACAVPA